MTPRPWASVCMKSAILSIGSPKNLAPPWPSICINPRWMAPILAALILPYSVVKSEAFSPTQWHIARRSFMSNSSSPSSSAILKTSCNTPACVSFRLSMRDKSKGPKSLTVARTGCPCSPKTSHNVAGDALNSGVASARSARTLASFVPNVPA